MEIEFKQIDKTNYIECIELSLNQEQEKFLAPNMFSLVQATYEPNFYTLAIYNNSNMVGFILYHFDDKLNGWSIGRFMVDVKYQNQGIGKIALQKLVEFFINKYGHIQLYISALVDNKIAIGLFKKIGFQKKDVFEYEARGNTYKELRMVVQL